MPVGGSTTDACIELLNNIRQTPTIMIVLLFSSPALMCPPSMQSSYQLSCKSSAKAPLIAPLLID